MTQGILRRAQPVTHSANAYDPGADRRMGFMGVTSPVTLQLSRLVAAVSGADKLEPVAPNARSVLREKLIIMKRIYNHELVVTRDELPRWK